MRKRQLSSLTVGGLFALAAAFPIDARGGNLSSDSDRLIETVMAVDRADLAETMALLEPALDEAQDMLMLAELGLQQSEIDAAGTLVTSLNAETAERDARKNFASAARILATAKIDLKRLQALPKSQENNAEITGLKAEIAKFQGTVDGLKTDFIKAEAAIQDARTEVGDSESDIADAKSMLDEARNTVAMVWEAIDTVQLAFHGERKKVDGLVAHLTKEQSSALRRSIGNAVAREPRVDIDAKHLRTILDNDYDARQIAFLASALEAEAKFLRIAARTGNDSFLKKAEQARQPFLAKIEHIEAEKFDAYMDDRNILQTASGPNEETPAEKMKAPSAEQQTTIKARPKRHSFVRGMLGLQR